MSAAGQAKASSKSLSKVNFWVVVVNVLGSLILILPNLFQIGEIGPSGLPIIGLGVAYLASAILAYLLIEAFSAHVEVNVEILQELEKANGYK